MPRGEYSRFQVFLQTSPVSGHWCNRQRLLAHMYGAQGEPGAGSITCSRGIRAKPPLLLVLPSTYLGLWCTFGAPDTVVSGTCLNGGLSPNPQHGPNVGRGVEPPCR